MKITIVTVSFNSGATIRDTFESILAQTYKNYEYIVVDGLSKDNTVDIIKEYEPLFNGKMRWISEKDSGLYDAMNKGIKMATGDIVGILNSDDFYSDNNVLSTIVDNFKKFSPEAVYANVLYVKPENTSCAVRHYSSKHFKRWKMRFGLMPAHPTFYAHKNLFERFGYYRTDYKIAADFDLLLRFIFINKIKMRYIDKDFVKMRTGGVSTNSVKVHWCIMKEHLNTFKENKYYTNVFMLGLRYFGKIYDIISVRFSHN